jgi:membrane-bound inhibitor of C-type lysozyme
MTRPRTLPIRVRLALVAAAAAFAASGCADKPSKDEQEAAKLAGERLVVRFDSGEARVLMPAGERIVLYQLPTASGVRFSNGTMELRGKGTDLQLVTDGTAMPLVDCQPYALPKPS